MNYHNIPAELRALNQWVVAGPNKIPLNPRSGEPADPTDPETWGTYNDAVKAGYTHVGFVLSKDDPYAIIDLDLPVSEEQAARHQQILEATESYAEISQSGNGVHIVVKGSIPHGVRRDKVEVYSSERYMIFTGDVLNTLPIAEDQEILDILYNEMVSTWEVDLEELTPTQGDEAVVALASGAENGLKFKTLWDGDFSEYPSQSEADFALMAILGFYSKSNAQCRRLFEESGLWRGSFKKNKRDKYMDYMLKKIRAKEIPSVDITELIKHTHELLARNQGTENDERDRPRVDCPPPPPSRKTPSANLPPPPPRIPSAIPTGESALLETKVVYPPGFVGELAKHFLASAVRPVPEIALISAIALLAGVVGRSYNISDAGLNQYIILIAETGTGKEGISKAIDILISEVRKTVPSSDRFMGPARFASGPALVKALCKRPCMVSILGEFGVMLQRMTDPRAPDAQTSLKGVFLDLYSKSGFDQVMRPSVYSDAEKDTAMVQAPNLTILGESTPQEFFGKLDASQVMSGLIPRFMVVEYKGKRPALNKQRGRRPSPELVEKFSEFLTIALTTEQNNTCSPVSVVSDAEALLDQFELDTTAIINSGANEAERNLWNRAHLKALKLAGLIAVGVNPQQPVVTKAIAEWALAFIRSEVGGMVKRYSTGDVGEGQSKQEHDLRRAIDDYLAMKTKERTQYQIPVKVISEPLVPYGFLRRRLRMVASFKNDRNGFSRALDQSLADMVKAGDLVLIAPLQARDMYDTRTPLYGLGTSY